MLDDILTVLTIAWVIYGFFVLRKYHKLLTRGEAIADELEQQLKEDER